MISENIDAIRKRISSACARAGRSSSDVILVAVAKTFPAAAVREAIAAGVGDIGENYVQEFLEVRERLIGSTIRWHFVGHLQSNKVKLIADRIDMIHAVDSASLMMQIDCRAAEAGRIINCLIEVNTTGERTKFGVRPGELTGLVTSLAGLEHVCIAGLMTIGPFLPDAEESRPMFRRLRELRDEVQPGS